MHIWRTVQVEISCLEISLNSLGNMNPSSPNWKFRSRRKSLRSLGAGNLANTRNTFSWGTRILQRSNQMTTSSPCGWCQTRPGWRQKSWSTQAPPWWRKCKIARVAKKYYQRKARNPRQFFYTDTVCFFLMFRPKKYQITSHQKVSEFPKGMALSRF